VRVRLAFRSSAIILLAAATAASTARAADSDVRVSSIGYLTARAKHFSVLGTATDFVVRRSADGSMAFAGTLAAPAADPSTTDTIAQGDFSALTEAGRFYVDVAGVGRSVDFPIGDDVLRAPFTAAMLGFYGWRCGTAVSFPYGSEWFGHGACHLGDGYLDYLGQTGAMRDGKGGWHDAGDFGKYTGNAGFTLGMLLSAFERHRAGIEQAPLPIPERGGALPDYLDELRWELEWMLKMIYGDTDGRVSHKLTALAFEAFILPENDLQTRYFVPFSSAATADFVAALAQASRIYRPYDPAFADTCLAAAQVAYGYLTANTANTPPDQTAFSTGGYTTTDPDDRLWAAAEMWETTGDATALADVETRIGAVSATSTLVSPDFDWGSVRNLGLYTYLLSARPGRTQSVVDRVSVGVMTAANLAASTHDASGYGRGVSNNSGAPSYYWGSNGSVARTAMLLAVANRLSGDARYLDVAVDQIAWLFGRNHYNRSQVTGLGIDPPLHPHHRPSAADGLADRTRACWWAAAPPRPTGRTTRTCTWSTRSPSTGTARSCTRWRCSCRRANGRRCRLRRRNRWTPAPTRAPPSTRVPAPTRRPRTRGPVCRGARAAAAASSRPDRRPWLDWQASRWSWSCACDDQSAAASDPTDARDVIRVARRRRGERQHRTDLRSQPVRRRMGRGPERWIVSAAWLADRKRMFARPMTVSLSDVIAREMTGGIDLSFTQVWTSGDYRDLGKKKMTLQRTPAGLRIAREEMVTSWSLPRAIRTDDTQELSPDDYDPGDTIVSRTDPVKLGDRTFAIVKRTARRNRTRSKIDETRVSYHLYGAVCGETPRAAAALGARPSDRRRLFHRGGRERERRPGAR
jgi:endoglucanase